MNLIKRVCNYNGAAIVKIGYDEIYPQQVDCGEACWSILKSRTKFALLWAQLQQGKTGVLVYVATKFLEEVEQEIRAGLIKTAEIVVFVKYGLDQILVQNEDRFDEYETFNEETGEKENAGAKLQLAIDNINAEFSTKRVFLQFVHLSNFRSKWKYNKVCKRLILTDEAHAALNLPNNNNLGGVYFKFLKGYGINHSVAPISWKEKDGTVNYLLETSATPHTHIKKFQNGYGKSEPFIPVLMELSEHYLSLAKLRDRCHMLTGALMFLGDDKQYHPTEQCKEIIAEFITLCKELGNGYLVIRLITGGRGKNATKRNEAFIQYLNGAVDGNPLRHETFGCNEKKNDETPIKDLPVRLIESPQVPTILFIKGSMRAGMTLPRKHYIRSIVEPTAMNGKAGTDSLVQSLVGRSCGYGKQDDVYPVYCNTDKMDEQIALYSDAWAKKNNLQDVKFIPATVHAGGKKTRKEASYRLLDESDLVKKGSSHYVDGKQVIIRSAVNTDGKKLKEDLYKLKEDKTAHILYKDKELVLNLNEPGREGNGLWLRDKVEEVVLRNELDINANCSLADSAEFH